MQQLRSANQVKNGESQQTVNLPLNGTELLNQNLSDYNSLLYVLPIHVEPITTCMVTKTLLMSAWEQFVQSLIEIIKSSVVLE